MLYAAIPDNAIRLTSNIYEETTVLYNKLVFTI